MTRKYFLPFFIVLFLAGIISAGVFKEVFPLGSVMIFAGACLLFMFPAGKKPVLFYIFLGLFFLSLGFFRYGSSNFPRENDISTLVSGVREDILVSGVVLDVPEEKGASYLKHTVFPLKVEAALKDGKTYILSGKILVDLYNTRENPGIGDRLVIGGKISLPREADEAFSFDRKTYLSHKGIYSVLTVSKTSLYLRTGVSKSPVYRLRRVLERGRGCADRVLRKYLSGTAAGITAAVTLGKRGGITPQLKALFAETGTTHILAVSGLHICIVAGILAFILKTLNVPRGAMCFFTIAGVLLFAVFAGSRASSLRAAVMVSFAAVGLFLDRKPEMISLLALSAFVITYFSPGQLFMPGFILSYLAVIALVYLTPYIDTFFLPRRSSSAMSFSVTRYFAKGVSVSCAAFLGTMPVIAMYFRIITPASIIANLAAVPILFIIVASGLSLIVTGLTGFMALPAGVISFVINAAVSSLVAFLGFIRSLPFSSARVASPGLPGVLALYAAVFAAAVFFFRGKRRKVFVLIITLVMGNFFVWNEVFQGPPDSTRVTFFDIGSADAFLLEASDGSVVLIDAGRSGREGIQSDGERVIEPYLRQRGIRKIDLILLTHAHDDHMGGLFHIIREFDTGCFIDGAVSTISTDDRKPYNRLAELIEKKGIRHFKVKSGDIIEGIAGMSFYVLNPPEDFSYKDPNNDSVAIKAVDNNGKSILFSADVGAEAIKGILCFGSFLKADVIKMPHHGKGAYPVFILRQFLDFADPDEAVITNKENGVNKRIIEELEKKNIDIRITGRSGTIIMQ